MNDDKGWLFDDNSNTSFWGIDKIKSTYAYFSDEDLTTEGSSTKIYEINLYTSMEKNYYTRYYMKIQNVLIYLNIFVLLFQVLLVIIYKKWKFYKIGFFLKKRRKEI